MSCGPPSEARGEQRRPLARVVRGWSRGVASVIAGDQQDTSVQGGDQLRQPPVERLDARGVALRVVPVAVLRVEVDQVGEDERGRRPPQVLERQIDAVVVGVRVPPLRDALAGEDVLDLADAEDGDARPLQPIERRRARRGYGEVPPLRAPDERARVALRTVAR